MITATRAQLERLNDLTLAAFIRDTHKLANDAVCGLTFDYPTYKALEATNRTARSILIRRGYTADDLVTIGA